MVETSDIVQIFVLAAILFIPLGYFLQRHMKNWKKQLSGRFLIPRYLKPIKVAQPPKIKHTPSATGKNKNI